MRVDVVLVTAGVLADATAVWPLQPLG